MCARELNLFLKVSARCQGILSHDMKSLQTNCKIKTLQARVETSPGVAQPLPPTSIPKKPGPGDGGGGGGGGGD